MSGRSYSVISVPAHAASAFKVGDTVYPCGKADYGCAAADTRHTGVLHISCGLNADGDYPFFTMPETALRANS